MYFLLLGSLSTSLGEFRPQRWIHLRKPTNNLNVNRWRYPCIISYPASRDASLALVFLLVSLPSVAVDRRDRQERWERGVMTCDKRLDARLAGTQYAPESSEPQRHHPTPRLVATCCSSRRNSWDHYAGSCRCSAAASFLPQPLGRSHFLSCENHSIAPVVSGFSL